MYELYPNCFLTAPRLAWQGPLKKAKVKLDLLTDTNMFSMGENGIRGILYYLLICKS